MNIKLTNKFFAALSICTSVYSSNVIAEEFKILDFRFGMNEPSFTSWNQGGQSPTPIDPSQYGTLKEGIYQGTNTSNVLVNFTFFTVPVYVYTNSGNLGSTLTPVPGSIPGGPTPTIDLVGLTADMSSWFATWSGTEFNQGNNDNHAACASNPNSIFLSDIATVVDNNDGTYRVNWSSCITGGSFDSMVGFWQLDLDCTTCIPTKLGEADLLTASQNGGPDTVIISKADGNVVISSTHGASPAGYTFNWRLSKPVTDLDAAPGTYTFDPSTLEPGNYVFNITYQNNNTLPDPTKGNGEIILRIVNSVTGDIGDANANRIENKNDADLANNQLQSSLGSTKDSYALKASSGSMRLGKTAFCASSAARITPEELSANASSSCGTTINSVDNLLKDVGVGGYYDFEVTNINQGETIDIVIPLTESIPGSAVYRKYNETTGWATFITEGKDKLSSAMSTSEGNCPTPTSDLYEAGLIEGYDCVRLSITDGGPNDTDNQANGLIKDPGGVAEINSGTEANLPSGCSISGKQKSLADHAEWLLALSLIAWLGFSARQRKQ